MEILIMRIIVQKHTTGCNKPIDQKSLISNVFEVSIPSCKVFKS